MISVIMPTFNRSRLLGRAILSVLNQSHKDFELIIIDDGSTDNTQEIVDMFRDNRIRYIKHDKNLGVNASRNTGIDNSKGVYITFLDSDDEWFPDKLKKQWVKIQEVSENVGIIYCGYLTINNNTCEVLNESVPFLKGNVYSELLRRCFIVSGTVFIRRNCFKEFHRFDESLHGCEDWDMWLRLSNKYEIDFIPDTLVKIYIHGDQATANIKLMLEGRMDFLEKHKDEIGKYPHIYSYHLKRIGILNSFCNNRYLALQYLVKSLKLNLLDFRIYGHLILSALFPMLHKYLLKRNRSIINIDNYNIFY